jgi:hypothetical protein
MNYNTFQTVYYGEVRNIVITILDNDYELYSFVSGTYTVKDMSGTEIIEETEATVSSNSISFLLNTSLLDVDSYYIMWKIVDSFSRVYYHKTTLNVISLEP